MKNLLLLLIGGIVGIEINAIYNNGKNRSVKNQLAQPEKIQKSLKNYHSL